MNEKFPGVPESANEGIERGIRVAAEKLGISEDEFRTRMREEVTEEDLDDFLDALSKIVA
jgi:hypothetical protein